MRRPGTIITPDWYAAEANNPISDYACLKHFFQCKETGTGAVTLTDSKGGLTIPELAITSASDGIQLDPATNTAKAILGTLVTPGALPYLIVSVHAVSSVTTNYIGIGDTTSGLLAKIYAQVASSVDTGAAASLSINAGASGPPITEVCAYALSYKKDDAEGLRLRWNKTSGGATWTAATPVTTAGSPDMPSPAAVWDNHTGIKNLHGLAVFVFADGLPSEASIREAVTYMHYQWQQGNKVIWPGWRHLP